MAAHSWRMHSQSPRLSEPIEALEPRIAPALIISPTGTSATFTDVDGDIVTVSVSHGLLERSCFALTKTGAAVGGGKNLLGLSLSRDATEFAGADLFITATPGPLGGDGHVNVGSLFAEGADLGRVNVDGDLGCVVAGDGTAGTPAIASLTVGSFGNFAGTNLRSHLYGGLGSLKVRGDFARASLTVDGSIGSLNIRGSLIGSELPDSGEIDAKGFIGSIKVGGGIYGGSGQKSGTIHARKALGSTSIAGDIVPGSGVYSGSISSNAEVGSVVANISVDATTSDTVANGGLIKTGAGTLTFISGSNVFTGGTAADSGAAGSDSSTPPPAPPSTPVSGGTLVIGINPFTFTGGSFQFGGTTTTPGSTPMPDPPPPA